jgi:TonB-linked SusC/RagA family outer membrane protein
VKNEPVSNVLSPILNKQNLSYEFKGNHILISLKKENKQQAKPVNNNSLKKISGKVINVNGETIIGANVVETGEVTNGTITNVNGEFSLTVSEHASIRISYIGFIDQIINTRGKTFFEIILLEDTKTLDEIVVVGYGTQKKVNLPGAINQISAETLVDRPVVKISSALQGAIPNLSINFSGGAPGEMGSLNIRGYTSINGGTPLVLIDGIPGTLDRLSPEEVETVTVLKDASSAAIYGARAAFGVILITTKEGSSSKTRVSYNTNIAFSTPTINTDFITTGYDWIRLNDASAAYMGGYSGYTDEDMYQLYLRRNDKTVHPDRPWITIQNRNGKDQYVYYGNYDWWSYLFKEWQTSTNHNVNITGGNDKVNYMLNGNIKNAEGIMNIHPDNFRSAAIRSKITAQVYKWLKISNNTNFFHSSYDYAGREGGGNANFTNMTVHASPAYAPINPDGTATYKSGLNAYAIGDGTYPLFFEGNSKGADRKYELTTITEAIFSPFKDLSIIGNYSYSFYFSPNFYRQEPASFSLYPGIVEPTPNYTVDQLKERLMFNQVHVINVYGNYAKKFDEHNFKVVAGFNQEVHYNKSVTAQRDNLLSETMNDLSLGTGIQEVLGGSSAYALRGVFFRLNYDYKGKYLFEANGRYDGTSRFPKDRRFGFFPSVSGAWRVSEEDFFAGIRNIIPNLKIRGSYGSLGNQAISSPYPYISTMNPGTLTYIQNGKLVEYIASPAPISGNLTWETVTSVNGGFDISFLNNKLELSFDRYARSTKGMVARGLQLPNVYGATEPNENSADLLTQGFELTLSGIDSFKLLNKKFS